MVGLRNCFVYGTGLYSERLWPVSKNGDASTVRIMDPWYAALHFKRMDRL